MGQYLKYLGGNDVELGKMERNPVFSFKKLVRDLANRERCSYIYKSETVESNGTCKALLSPDDIKWNIPNAQ